MVQQIALATKTITADNTPEKKRTDTLSIHPVWKYRGPACTINFEWSVGQWKLGTYDGITDEYHATINQVESLEWQEFEAQIALPSIPLDKVSPRDEPYVAEMWFRGPFPDLCVRVDNCVKIVEEVLEFDVMPTALPAEVAPGEEVTITCRITSRCTRVVDGYMECLVREGSIYGPPGDILDTYTSDPFTISPGQAKTFTFKRTAVEGTIDRRDIDIVVFVDDQKAISKPKESWDDVYYVKAIVLHTLEVDITPSEGGYVTTEPEAVEGHPEERWYDNDTGKFEYGTRVRVTAHPHPGYKFDHWSDEIEGGVSYDNPEYVAGTMTEHRAVKCHFEEEVVEEFTLGVSVEPYGSGSVTASPSKTTYSKGEQVVLTATPYSGYEFDYWSGDASGYSSSITIYMNKDMVIIANFKSAVPDPTTKVSFSVKGDGFPFATSYWKLYHYDREDNIWQDYIMHRPGDIISVRNVQSAGRLSCHCCNLFTGEWSEQFYSVEFAAIDGEDYRYDIASGIVYYR